MFGWRKMSNPFSRIKKGDYAALQEALMNNFSDKTIPRELLRIVSNESFLGYIESSDVRDIVVSRVLEHCINARIYLNYSKLLQAVLKKRLVGSLGLLCSYGITYIVPHDTMLKVIGEKPDDRSIQMFNLYMEGALRNTVKPILFVYACMNLQIAWSESINIMEVLNTAIGRNEHGIVRLLVLSQLYLDDEKSISQVRNYANENEYDDLIELLEQGPDTSIVFGGDAFLSLADPKSFNNNSIRFVEEVRKLSYPSVGRAYIYAVDSDNYEELIKKAKKLKIDPDMVDDDGMSALSYLMSAERKKTSVISALIEAGANPFSTTNRRSFLMPGKVLSNQSILKSIDDQNPTLFSVVLINLPKERLDDVVSNNRTLLELVIETNNVLLVRLALTAGAYVNTIEHPALNVAIMNGNEEIIDMIMKRTEIFDQVDMSGNTSLHMAIQFGNLEIARTITMADNDTGRRALRMQNGDGKFPLDLTDDEEFINEYILLLDMKTLEVQNEYSPLHTLIRKDMFDLVKLVTERMLHVEGRIIIKDYVEKTLFQIFQEDAFLDYAIKGGRTRIVKYFQSLGLKPVNKERIRQAQELMEIDAVKDYNLKTALVTQRIIDKVKDSKFTMKDAFILAAKTIHQNDKELLIYLFDKLGVPINEFDKEGNNLYDLAAGNESIKKLLKLYGFAERVILPTKASTKQDVAKRYEVSTRPQTSTNNRPQPSTNRSQTPLTTRHNDEDDETYIIVKDEDIRNQDMIKRDEEFARRLEQEEMSRITTGRAAAAAYGGPTTTQRSTRRAEETPTYSRTSIREEEQTPPNSNASGVRLTSKERTAKLLARKKELERQEELEKEEELERKKRLERKK